VAKTIHRNEYRQLVDLLRDRREAMGISQASVAQAVGWTQQKISYIETGARRMDVLEYIALARALGLSPVAAFRRAESVAPAKREGRPAKANRRRSA
jgi:transcriptional regulator with XRE-family HTH domain